MLRAAASRAGARPWRSPGLSPAATGCRRSPPDNSSSPPRCRVLSPVLGQSMNCPGNGHSYSRLCATGAGVSSRDCRIEVGPDDPWPSPRRGERGVRARVSQAGNHTMGLARPGWPACTLFMSMSALRFELARARKGALQPKVIARRGHPLAGVAAVPCVLHRQSPPDHPVLGTTTLAAIHGSAQAAEGRTERQASSSDRPRSRRDRRWRSLGWRGSCGP